MKILTKVLTVILAVLLVGAAAGVIAYFALKEEGVAFYVEYGGERYYSGIGGREVFLRGGENHVFSIRSIEGKDVEYTLKITANPDASFTFTADQNPYNFYRRDDSDMNDYTGVFAVGKDAETFNIDIPSGYTLQTVLEQKYGAEVVLPGNLGIETNYFILTVTSGENELNLPFRFESLRVELDPPKIIF